MLDSSTFAVDVVRLIGGRFAANAAELATLIEANADWEAWLRGEAVLACQQHQATYPFAEVVAQPTYASEGVAEDASFGRTSGDLRVGGPNDGENHCWAFIELFTRLDWIEEARTRLLRLGWKKSAALVLLVTLDGEGKSPVENWPTLLPPIVFALPNGQTITLLAYDNKRNPADTLVP